MRFLWYTPTEYCRLSPVALEVGAKKCNAGEYSICIEPNGDVLPCQSYYVSAGNILEDDWDKIWHTELFDSFRSREENPSEHGLPSKCQLCPDLLICGAGCRIEREAEAGVRVADIAGGGCVGCSGYFNSPDHSRRGIHEVNFLNYKSGYVPFASQIVETRRSSGQMDLIIFDRILPNNDDE
jgi:radical SAM protein with 4Fe4S-binding SPASM domain